jgi:ABC-type multidrug transport system permease subunit
MSPAFTIALHHLRRVVRNPGLILLLVAIPLTLAVIEYGAFGRTAAAGKLPPVKVLFLDEDKSFLSGAVPQVFAGGPMKDSFELATTPDRDTARRLFQRNQASALVVAPAGFQDAVLEGRRAELMLYKNPIQGISPDIAASVLEIATIIGNGLYGQAIEPIRRVRTIVDQKREPSADEVAEVSKGFFLAGQRLGSLGVVKDVTVAVRRPGDATGKTAFGTDPKEFFAYVFPGLVIFALLFIAQALALRLLRDRLRGLQRRLIISPVSPAAVIGGSVLYLVVALFVLLLVLATIGALVFRIELRNPPALLAVSIGFAVFAAALHLLSMALARSDRSASFVGTVVVMLLSLVGGTFIPADQYPPFLQRLAMLVPNGAAQQGFIDVLVHRRGLAEIGGHLAVTWTWGLGLIAAAAWLERRRMRA